MPDQPRPDNADERPPTAPGKSAVRKDTKEPPPTGTKGEELSSQGQLDEATRKRGSHPT
jgi:hypothetical protein